MKLRTSLTLALTVFAALLGTLSVQAQSAMQSVNCDNGGTIAGALPSLKPGDTLVVSGTCNESINILAEASRLTLDGQGKATIQSADTAPNVIQIEGREITIKGFTISGGRNGIAVVRGGTAVIDGNTIQNSGAGRQPGSGLGINVAQLSFAAIINNTIQNNNSVGILVHENSAARIGFVDVAGTGLPNIIQNNGTYGIQVTRGAIARVVGATVQNNGADGILVERASQAEVANNTISGNTGNGITVTGNSGVDIVIGAATVDQPNKTDAGASNGGFGIQCSQGAYISGSLGTLTGAAGTMDLDATCINALRP